MAEIDLSSHAVPNAAADRCFLCGDRQAPDQITREHVFPKWLLRKANLFDRKLRLLNGTFIPYRALTVPACAVCNGIILSRVENQLAQALPRGANAVRALGHELIYVWLAKLFFGILYAEGLLSAIRATPSEGPIVPGNVLQSFQELHFLMQASRTRMVFYSEETNFHSSILVFPVQQHPERAHRFMYRDDLNYGCMAVRLDTVGLICVVDGGAQELLANELMSALFRHNLHPLQFEEVCAKVFMKARTQTRSASYLKTFTPGLTQVIQMPLAGLSSRPIFGEWDQDEYGRMVAEFTSLPLELVSPGNGKVATWIEDLTSPRFMDVRDYPWP